MNARKASTYTSSGNWAWEQRSECSHAHFGRARELCAAKRHAKSVAVPYIHSFQFHVRRTPRHIEHNTRSFPPRARSYSRCECISTLRSFARSLALILGLGREHTHGTGKASAANACTTHILQARSASAHSELTTHTVGSGVKRSACSVASQSNTNNEASETCFEFSSVNFERVRARQITHLITTRAHQPTNTHTHRQHTAAAHFVIKRNKHARATRNRTV